MCRYQEGFLLLTKMLKPLIPSDREGNRDTHLQAIQDQLPISREFDSIHYLCYAAWHFRKNEKTTIRTS